MIYAFSIVRSNTVNKAQAISKRMVAGLMIVETNLDENKMTKR